MSSGIGIPARSEPFQMISPVTGQGERGSVRLRVFFRIARTG